MKKEMNAGMQRYVFLENATEAMAEHKEGD
jgi:hypothetical protein